MQIRFFPSLLHPRGPVSSQDTFLTLDTLFDLITSDRYRETVLAIRPKDKAERAQLKRKTLPVVQFQVSPTGPNPVLVIDFEVDPHLKAPFQEAILMEFDSPSGAGAKAIALRLPDSCAASWELYEAYAKAVEAELGITSSHGQASRDRVRFLSWDPKAYYNPEASPYIIQPQEPFLPVLKIDGNTDSGRAEFRLFRQTHNFDEAVAYILSCDRTGSASLWADNDARQACTTWEAQHKKRLALTPDEPRFLGDTLTDPDQDDNIWMDRNKVIPPLPVLVVAPCGAPVLWAGGITTVVGASKSGKSHLIMAIVDAACGGASMGFRSTGPAVDIMYFDMEMELPFMYEHLQRMSPRIKVASLRAYKPQQALEIIARQINKHRPGMVVLDTSADMVNSTNDEEETSALVRALMALADNGCAILSTLHFNPGSDAKTRGHLGSHLERKSTHLISILTDKNDQERKKVSSQKSRKNPLKPFWIVFDEHLGYFVPTDKPGKETKVASKDAQKMEAVRAVFTGLSFESINEAAVTMANQGWCSIATASRWVKWALETGIIIIDDDNKFRMP